VRVVEERGRRARPARESPPAASSLRDRLRASRVARMLSATARITWSIYGTVFARSLSWVGASPAQHRMGARAARDVHDAVRAGSAHGGRVRAQHGHAPAPDRAGGDRDAARVRGLVSRASGGLSLDAARAVAARAQRGAAAVRCVEGRRDRASVFVDGDALRAEFPALGPDVLGGQVLSGAPTVDPELATRAFAERRGRRARGSGRA
jgi:hypothetical protein